MRSRWTRLLPVMMVAFIIAFMDRTNIVTLYLIAVLAPFMPVAAINGDTQSASNTKYAAIVKFQNAGLLCAGAA